MELNQDEPGFDFGANLETHDSVSSLNQLGVSNGDGGDVPSSTQLEGKWEGFKNGDTNKQHEDSGVGVANGVSKTTSAEGSKLSPKEG